MMRGGGLSSLLPNPNRKTLTLTLAAALLSLASYLTGVYHHHSRLLPLYTTIAAAAPAASCRLPPSAAPLDFLPHHSAADTLPPLPSPLPPVLLCPPNFTDHCPCQDPRREVLFPTRDLLHRERHCPAPADRNRCRVPPPHGYRPHVPWPDSRGYVWFANVPSKRLTVAKADQNWVRLEGDRLVFPGGGTSFAHGVKLYVGEMAKLIPLRSGEIRTALDTGCGVSIKAAY